MLEESYSGCDFKDATGKLQWFPSMPKGENFGKYLTNSTCLFSYHNNEDGMSTESM
jgi:hypothetical protein